MPEKPEIASPVAEEFEVRVEEVSGAAVAPCTPTPSSAPAVRTETTPTARRFLRKVPEVAEIWFLFNVDPFDSLRPVRR
ncbi:MAG TPA: hypothetical protein DCP11_05015 [Microbacteriaceae bacterium]|nr:hypothetical protein [Microbacteriaceae bacterium]